jgi:hypothetical protein
MAEATQAAYSHAALPVTAASERARAAVRLIALQARRGPTALGWIADQHRWPAALWASAFLALVGFVAVCFLPAPRAS